MRVGSPELPIGAVPLREREVVTGVAVPHRRGVTLLREALAGERPDRVEHREPRRFSRSAVAHEQALGHEPVERVEIRAGDRLRRADRRPAGEYGEAGEGALLGLVEQRVAPVDRRAQRPVAGGRIAGARAERAEGGVEPLRDLGR